MKTFKASVLVTFYNQENYVNIALNSIMQQCTSYPIQIIIGDDGSSDSTVKKVQYWQEKYPDCIEIHIMERDALNQIAGFRASRIRLKLLQYVKGEFFIFLDGDDYFTDPDKLQKQIDILSMPQNQDCIACAHNISALFPDGKELYLSETGIREGKYDLKSYWVGLYFHTDTLLIRSKIISQIPTNLIENNYNDNMITFLTFQYGKIYYLPEAMAVYLQTGNGIWTSGKQVVNTIRNLFLYDLCRKINPMVNKETDIRFYQSWMKIFKLRHQMRGKDMVAFVSEAQKRNLVYSLYWLKYPQISLSEKVRLYMRMGGVLYNAILYKAGKKMQKLGKRS